MNMTPLHPDFGVEIEGIDLTSIAEGPEFNAVRRAFEEHSLLLFRNQDMDDPAILRLGNMFGPVENRTDGPEHVARVSNILPDGSVSLPDALHTKNLKANMLWHTDSTFLPVPALLNLITARVVPDSGAATELVSTRAGFARLPDETKDQARRAVVRHSLMHSRQKIDPELTKMDIISKWSEQSWKAVWPNPVTGEEGLYLASHAFGIHGMEDAAAQGWIDKVIDGMTTPDHIYRHEWREGDVLIWDERATLHRATPWDYAEARELASICVSATVADGVDAVRPA